MPVPTIAVFVGSLRRESCNRRLALALEKLAGDRARFQYVRIDDLPLYNQDFDGSYPAQGTRLKDEVRGADAVLFVTPEYNRSVPGVLKNAIDIGSRPYGDSAFGGKPAAVIGAPSARSARPWPSSTCATAWPSWTCTCSANRRRSSISRTS